MTALLELKQKIKNLYGQYEIYLLPVIKFAVALVYFIWINANMGYMSQLNNVFIVLILALICSILPPGVTVFVGFLLMIGHSYALGMETAAFMLIIILFIAVLFLRFSAGQNIVLVCTPLSFGFGIPALLPIGSGLMGNAFAAFPAGSGVILYYVIRLIRSNSETLVNPDVDMLEKLRILSDGLMQNWAMWITLVAFVAVILIVNLIRTRSFDFAWRISIITGGVAYILVMLGGSFFVSGVTVSLPVLLVQTILSVLVGIILEFFVFGGDYTRTERLEYEDDEYYYYVKAVPKLSVATPEKTVKRINERHGTEIMDTNKIRKNRQPKNDRAEKVHPNQRQSNQGRKRPTAKKGPSAKKHDIDEVNKLLLTQSLKKDLNMK